MVAALGERCCLSTKLGGRGTWGRLSALGSWEVRGAEAGWNGPEVPTAPGTTNGAEHGCSDEKKRLLGWTALSDIDLGVLLRTGTAPEGTRFTTAGIAPALQACDECTRSSAHTSKPLQYDQDRHGHLANEQRDLRLPT